MFSALSMLFVFVTLGFMAGVLGIPYSLLAGNVRRLYRIVVHGILPCGLRAGGIRVVVSGRERIPAETSVIFLANHVSNLDPPVLFPTLPGQSSVLLKKSLMRIPLLGTAMKMARFVPVDRGNQREAAKASVAAAGEALRSGLHMLVFAEGTRSRDGRLQRFKSGPFYLAMDTGAPIVPTIITGTEKMMRKHSLAITPGVARVTFLEPIWPKDYSSREALMDAARNAMIQALPTEMQPSQN